MPRDRLDSLVSQKPVCSSLLHGTVILIPVKLKVPASVPPPSNESLEWNHYPHLLPTQWQFVWISVKL